MLLLAGCSLTRGLPKIGDSEEGQASYYANSLEGRPTASGEPYRGDALTCAHRTLPFGTVLEVTSLDNSLSVVVRVNDRGLSRSGRVIDLSRRAARELGLLHRGTGWVRLRVLDLPPPRVAQ